MKRVLFFAVTLTFCTQGCAESGRLEGFALQEADAVPERSEGAGRAVNNVDLPRFPSISPDGRWIVFSWRGDLWKVASTGGQAVRLTTHSRDDLRSAWSRDGRRIAFDSNRNGYQNIYIMNGDGTDVRQVTDIDVSCTLDAFGVDVASDPRVGRGDEVITFSASLEGDNYRSPRPYMISTDGGEIRRVHDAFGSHAIVGPHGRRAAFTRGGARWSRRHYRGADRRNVWMYERADGTFKQLTHWDGNDGQAKWVGEDGLLYLSDRELNTVNLYRMDAERGDKNNTRLTSFEDNDIHAFDVSADGATVVLTAWDTLYTLDLTERDPTPKPLQISANEDEADNYEIKAINKTVREAALAPDGKVMAFIAYGEVYVRNIEEKSPTVRVTHDHARQKNVAWSPNGLKLYFVDDSDGTESIYEATVALTRSEVKEDFEKATKPPEEEEDEEATEEKPAEEDEDEAASDDDKGDEEGEESESGEEEEDQEDEDDKADEKKKDEELPKELQPDRWHDALKFNIEPVVQTEHNDRNPSPSPDGKSLAFRRGRGDLMILDLQTKETRTLVTGWDTGLSWRWSPDSKHIAYDQNDMNFNSDIWIVPADGSGEAVNITRHPDNDGNPRWSADGKILSFVSERVNEEYDVWMVYLDKDLEVLTPKEREKYYKDAVKAAKKRKPLKIEKPKEDEEDEGKKEGDAKDDDDEEEADDQEDDSKKDEEKDEDDEGDKEEDEDEEKEEGPPFTAEDLEDAYLRLRRVTTWNGSESNNEITPGGDRYIFTGRYGESGLYSIRWDGKERKKLTGSASVQHVSLTGDKVVFVSGGRAATVKPDGDKVEYVDISDKIRIDLQEQSSQKFLDAARILGERFYHPTMKNLDWAALAKRYHALARNARTASEFNHVAARFIGELNASHLGIRARGPSTSNAQSMGRLGTVHHRNGDGFEIINKIIEQSPADKGPMALKVGDVITAIELEPFGETDTVESRLRGRSGVETIVTIRRTTDDGEEKELNVLITPISFGAERQLKYKDWRRENARLVKEWSGGRIGYIHIQAMGQAALDVFERDLYAAASGMEGLIIDVRNNGGGWTTDRLLASIMVVPHAYTIPRGASHETGHYPQDRLFIQRYSLPINMLCNEKSFSNAEIISHAFKALKRGTLVGQETNGSVISTGGTGLIDGTFVRLPFRGWYLNDGTDMENHGARPHIIVEQTPQAEAAGDDEQLRATVQDLLKRL